MNDLSYRERRGYRRNYESDYSEQRLVRQDRYPGDSYRSRRLEECRERHMTIAHYERDLPSCLSREFG